MVTGEDIKYTSAVWEAGRKGRRATNKWSRSEVHTWGTARSWDMWNSLSYQTQPL